MKLRPDFEPIIDKNQPIPEELFSPHPFDERFAVAFGGRAIFLAQDVILGRGEPAFDDRLAYNYSDRIVQGYGEEKVRAALAEAKVLIGNTCTAAYFEAVLQRVYGDPTAELRHIVAAPNGMAPSYRIYGTFSRRDAEGEA